MGATRAGWPPPASGKPSPFQPRRCAHNHTHARPPPWFTCPLAANRDHNVPQRPTGPVCDDGHARSLHTHTHAQSRMHSHACPHTHARKRAHARVRAQPRVPGCRVQRWVGRAAAQRCVCVRGGGGAGMARMPPLSPRPCVHVSAPPPSPHTLQPCPDHHFHDADAKVLTPHGVQANHGFAQQTPKSRKGLVHQEQHVGLGGGGARTHHKHHKHHPPTTRRARMDRGRMTDPSRTIPYRATSNCSTAHLG